MSDTKTMIYSIIYSRIKMYRNFSYKRKFAIPNKCFSNAVGIEIKQHNWFCLRFSFTSFEFEFIFIQTSSFIKCLRNFKFLHFHQLRALVHLSRAWRFGFLQLHRTDFVNLLLLVHLSRR